MKTPTDAKEVLETCTNTTRQVSFHREADMAIQHFNVVI